MEAQNAESHVKIVTKEADETSCKALQRYPNPQTWLFQNYYQFQRLLFQVKESHLQINQF